MTETSTAPAVAAFTLANLEGDNHLELIDWCKTECEAIEAGMFGLQSAERTLPSAMHAAQMRAMQDVVQDALGHGVPAEAIRAITYRDAWSA